MRTAARPGIPAALTALALAACGTDDAEPADPDVPDDEAAAEAEVDIVDNGFDPADVEIATGEGVAWENTGGATHTVTFDEGPDSGSLASGDRFAHTFDEAGEFSYVCAIHPAMVGTVTVSD